MSKGGEQAPDAPEEVRDLHRAIVLNGQEHAANRVKPYAADSAFARDVKVLEDLGDKLLTATLDHADVTALIRASGPSRRSRRPRRPRRPPW